MKKILLILIIFALSGCGYSAVYKKINNEEIKLSIQSMSGDKYINNLLRTKLKNYSSNKSNKDYILNINSQFIKSITSKDKTGRATNVQLILRIEFDVLFDKKQENFIFEENLNIENSSNAYQQKNYENIIKNNFINTIINEFMLQLNTLK